MLLLVHDDRLKVAPAVADYWCQPTEFGFKMFGHATVLAHGLCMRRFRGTC
jgi:hypothetical protein